MLNYPIRQISIRNNEQIIETKIDYDEGLAIDKAGLILPHKESVKHRNGLMRTISTYDKYDENGNNLSITDNLSGDKVCYLWSYKGSYPVVKIVGLNYSEVEEILGPKYIYNLWKNVNPDWSEIEAIRSKFEDKEVIITTYTYKLLVGMLTETDFRGVTKYYNYDGLGRLTEVKVGEKKIEEYEYQYKMNNE
jgi:YD repeat-containing protein